MPLTQQVKPSTIIRDGGDINTPQTETPSWPTENAPPSGRLYSFFVSFLAGFLAVVFLGAAFLAAPDCGALLLVTRPD
jgi:uncharacterized RDD family membrane protein YckC